MAQDKMRDLVIQGGNPLAGTIRIDGSKNSAIPCISAALLTHEEVEVSNVPNVSDVWKMARIIDALGGEIRFDAENRKMKITAETLSSTVPRDISASIRGSTIFMGSLLARCGLVRLGTFGGCPIGLRPIDIHLEAFRKLGADVKTGTSGLEIRSDGLRAAHLRFRYPSVGATENAILAASLAEGCSCIENAAIEPEIVDLVAMVNRMGISCRIDCQTRKIFIQGTEAATGCSHEIIPDRIETGTYAVAAAITRGGLHLKQTEPDHLHSTLNALRRMGISVSVHKRRIEVHSDGKAKACTLRTAPYPGFPTDMQPQFAALATLARGQTVITEKIYENRFHHVSELRKMGANLVREKNTLRIKGVESLKGAVVEGKDLRGTAALFLAALAAKGKTKILSAYHVDRGYPEICRKLSSVGAELEQL